MSNWMERKALREEAQQATTRANSILEQAHKVEKREALTPEENTEFEKCHEVAEQKLALVRQMDRQVEAAKSIEERIGREEFEKPEPENKQGAWERYLRFGERSPEIRALSAGTSTEGAEFVPQDFYSKYELYLRDLDSLVEAGAEVIPTSDGRPLPIPIMDATANSSEIVAEKASVTDDDGNDPNTSEILLSSYSISSEVVKLSMQLVRDSAYDIEGALAQALAHQNAEKINNLLSVGTGSNQPKGVVTCSSAGKTGAATAAVSYFEILDLIDSVKRCYRKNGKLMWTSATQLAAKKLVDGNGNPLWNHGNVASGAPSIFDGFQVVINDGMADMGASAKSILFGDFSYYKIRKVNQSEFFRFDDSAYMKKLLIGFLMVDFIDGNCSNPNAIKHFVNAAS